MEPRSDHCSLHPFHRRDNAGQAERPHGEVVVLRLSGPLAGHSSSVVVPFLLPDIPVVAWWPDIAPAVPAQDPLGQLAIRRITDATNGVEPFPPASVLEPWNEVTTRTIQKKYPLCGVTYDLAFTSFGAYTGTSLGEATTAHDYLTFVVDSKGGGGQKVIANHDYLALPKGKVLDEAQKGAALIGF